MTELEALNMLLKLIGLRPVTSLLFVHPDVTDALTALTRIRRKAQIRGWWFNTTYNVTYYPDGITKEIALGTNVLSAVTEDSYVLKRGTKFFNSEYNTYQFDQPLCVVRLIENLEWDLLPDSMKHYIAYYAAAEFVRDKLGDENKKKDLERDAGISMLDLKAQELSENQLNIFTGPRVLRARGGVSPYSGQTRNRFSGTPDA
jgi:hypothetical protein